MSIKVALEHYTGYEFAHPVNVAPHVIRLRPAPHARTPIEAYSLDIQPANHFLNWQQDPFGNWLARIVFPEKVSKLEITVGVVADMMVINPLDFFIEEYAERFPFAYDPALAADLAPYLRPVDDAVQADAWRSGLPPLPDDGLPTVLFLSQLNRAVAGAVDYSVRMEPGVQTPDHTLASGIGSCRDSAWLLVSLLRQYGLAARFVSGYLVQLASDQKSLDGPSGPEHDFTDLHAWAEVFIPGAGWIGLDATSALFAGEGHIPLSATPHPSSAAPITGATDPVGVTFSFHNEVRRIHEDPRTTKPYTDEQWARIDAAGELVDERLRAGDVRLTLGGEPTFVALDDATAAEWNTDADGPHKRELANLLAERLRQTYALGGIVHRGQGKWYPGEPLPRWNIALQWRTDGIPLWEHADLFADPWSDAVAAGAATDGAAEGAADPATDGTTGAKDAPAAARAEALARRVTALLGLPPEQLLGAYEDPLASLAADLRQPDGPRPSADHPKTDDLDAADVAELDASVTAPTGFVLPLAMGEEWSSPAWRFRRGRLVLTPGSSAVGLRLPLDAVAWTDPEREGEPSYVEAGPPLDPALPPVTVVSPEGAATTALAFESRDGHVHVFLPPTTRLDDYAALLRVIETAAVEVGTPLVLEGYGPPPDARLTQLIVTPDPGVIEVNVQPTSSWAEQRALTFDLYEQARQARLSTEKFDLDGTHTGTGGGNHITLGGRQPIDSPLLRRPDLLASLITYWQRHPSLSYLFSGRFIGPTSQAPRFDEGRPEAVYEMEIALQELRRLAAETEEPRPWLVDRALRHLLTDLTGNTHRAEFCIDKLYSPDSSRGRLGLLELRGFEMPPHPQLALVQALLVRGLVAMFWEQPLTAPLVRWGTALHEDFLLPQGARRDIGEVVADLRAHGIAFEESWLEPFVEFRFPRIGVTRIDPGITLELRQAIEPWHVLGEEATAGGTARYVDSSVERIQVTVAGIDPARHLVVVGGAAVPLTPTGKQGEYYAGIRYRAWQPWSALHPSIAVHAPLTVEVIDADAAVSLGGATYHVVHPGGRAYEHPPVNANEAEARRSGRFEPRGHTPGRFDVAAAREAGARAATSDYPRTLDLRRVPPA
ncbi:MAG: transglutaminase [Microbacterium sp. SCN 70-200]|uniref:transglutaminase family protein n=1 Tax=unclassified Microbacterium TaxID=2609290 RepID=UPI00086F54FC|nr:MULTISPECIES: transglutaminase family protein [unclassified Microbacterium]MBN9215371.1 transglutaminase family protein [Microbacterium sp.]ODT42800.1 MAG: transglutaminase [Microbacterium sp. SCN 70-200]OJV81400.1 MAG: transglutaminase [Microbacterium sp. 70-16]